MAPPTSYKPAYCNEVIECLGKGYSVAGFAGHIGVAKSSVYKWVKDFPDFAAAYEIGKAKCAYHWETKLLDFAATGKGNVGAFVFGLGNRCPEEWRNVQKVEHTGKDGQPIKTQEVSPRDKLFELISRVAQRERETDDNQRTTH